MRIGNATDTVAVRLADALNELRHSDATSTPIVDALMKQVTNTTVNLSCDYKGSKSDPEWIRRGPWAPGRVEAMAEFRNVTKLRTRRASRRGPIGVRLLPGKELKCLCRSGFHAFTFHITRKSECAYFICFNKVRRMILCITQQSFKWDIL